MRSVSFWLALFILLAPSSVQAAGSTVRDFNAAYTASQAALAKNDHLAAINHTEEAFRIHKELFGPQTRDGAALSLNLTRLYGATERWTNAVLAAEEGVRIVEALGGENDSALAPLLYELGNAHVQVDQYDAAVGALERALTASGQVTDAMKGDIHSALAKAYGGRDELSDMRKNARAAKKAYEKAYGPNSYQVGGAIYQLGAAAHADNRYLRALRLYDDALEIFNKTLPSDHPMVISLLEQTKKLAVVEGKADTARTYVDQLNAANPGKDKARLVDAAPPVYPSGAWRKKTEGWVMVEFTITKEGLVKETKVVKSDPPGVFDKPTLKAIKKWKFAPKLEDGIPVEFKGYRQLIIFEKDD